LQQTPRRTFFPFRALELEVLPSCMLSVAGGGAIESEMRMGYEEDAYKSLLEKRELRRTVSAAFAAVAEHSPMSDSCTMDSERTIRSFAMSSIHNASSCLSTCNGEKEVVRALSSSDVWRVCRCHVRPLGLRLGGMPPYHTRCTTETETEQGISETIRNL
jgi:hypothetical protein